MSSPRITFSRRSLSIFSFLSRCTSHTLPRALPFHACPHGGAPVGLPLSRPLCPALVPTVALQWGSRRPAPFARGEGPRDTGLPLPLQGLLLTVIAAMSAEVMNINLSFFSSLRIIKIISFIASYSF